MLNDMLDENGFYKTKDLYLASTLVTLDYPYTISRVGKQFFFHFEDNKEANLLADIENYWSKNLLVDPISLFNSFKELKTRMYDKNI